MRSSQNDSNKQSERHTAETFLRGTQTHVVGELPIVASFCRQIGIADIVDRHCPSNRDISAGTAVTTMILDTLTGRSPLYRVEDFWEGQDMELLLGEAIDPSGLNDDTLGRTLDSIHEAGSMKIFTEISLEACRHFGVKLEDGSFDTTSVNVWGDYDNSKPGTDAPHICHGYSKDKRPDLKQFMISLLCVEGNIPVIGKIEDGNKSDVTANNEELQNLAAFLKKADIDQADFLYIADCKVVNKDNLELLGNNPFITRLPASYKANQEAVFAAIEEAEWTKVGKLNLTPDSKKRPAASYSYSEQKVTLYDREYRALVVHSGNLDKRKQKGIERRLKKAETAAGKQRKEAEKERYKCEGDAERALEGIEAKTATDLCSIHGEVIEEKRYARGRVAKGQQRKVTGTTWRLKLSLEENVERLEKEYQLAGHFILLSNVPTDGEKALSGEEVIRKYKAQHGIEQNFSFLKEPWIANDTFLKLPERIEALGLILLLSLLVWSLMQRAMRKNLEEQSEEEAITLTNLDKKPTDRPTSFILVHKFKRVKILRHGSVRVLSKPLNRDQRNYLRALGQDIAIFTEPPPKRS